MNLDLQTMIDAFERISLDERLHLIITSEEDLQVCIEFNRADQFQCWTFYFRDAREESKRQCSRSHALEVATAFRLSHSEMAKELAGMLLTQAAFADQFVREVEELLGKEAVKESIIRTQLFMDALKDAVSNALTPENNRESSERPVHSLAPALPPPVQGNPKLRVIKGS
ncbi:MAG: hypothetical protein RIR26_2021 [Pseudomonadota bacterium]|jgi:hypothetical protein